jgi:hypothetical protein
LFLFLKNPQKHWQDKLGKDFKAVLQKFQTCSQVRFCLPGIPVCCSPTAAGGQVAVSKERDTVAQQRGRAASFKDERAHYADDHHVHTHTCSNSRVVTICLGVQEDARTALIEEEQRQQLAQVAVLARLSWS